MTTSGAVTLPARSAMSRPQSDGTSHRMSRNLPTFAFAATLIGALIARADPAIALESDWNDVNWRAISYDMRIYLCAREAPPQWCPEWNEWAKRNKFKLPVYKTDRQVDEERIEAARRAKAERLRKLEVAKTPKRVISDQIWQAVIKRLAIIPPTSQDYQTVNTRAFKDGDPAALELLGYFYATGYGVDLNYEKAYEFYALAHLAGAQHVRTNMDELWALLVREAQTRMREKFDRPGAARRSN